jgi:threonylcarbamoyladenosine tRNA methylthiotransferase MtaB
MQFEHLLASGFHEVVLTGLNLGTYCDGETTLAGLLQNLLGACRDARIRLASLEPDTLDEAFIAAIADPRVCPHFHMPLQSGDDATLARMNRRYRSVDFGRLVERILGARPDANIGADVIVGFPGETEESLQMTRRYVSTLPVGYLHVFSFSPRPGIGQPVAEPVRPPAVRERVAELRALSDRRRRDYQGRFVGAVRPAVIETTRTALTDNYLRLRLMCTAPLEPRALLGLRIGQDGAALTGSPC